MASCKKSSPSDIALQELMALIPEPLPQKEKFELIDSIIRDQIAYRAYMTEAVENLETIGRAKAECYFKLYNDRHLSLAASTDSNVRLWNMHNDNSRIIHLDLEDFMAAVHRELEINPCTPQAYANKAVLVYLAQYGHIGRFNDGSADFPETGVGDYLNHSTVIIGFADKAQGSSSFEVKEQHYNFGDIRPPSFYIGQPLTGENSGSRCR